MLRIRKSYRVALTIGVPCLILAGCSGTSEDATMEQGEISESSQGEISDLQASQSDEAQEQTVSSSANGRSNSQAASNLPVKLPQLAYIYDYSWRMPGEDIGKLQRHHADLCDQQGPATCQILGMNKSGEEADEITGELQMAVATNHARAFGALLEDDALDAGAEAISANIETEELSKKIVDTEAWLKSRIQLRDRLMEVLRTSKGDVEELVEAERRVAQINDEIDRARSGLKEMEERVAYSQVNVHYQSDALATNDFWSPVAGVIGSLGSIFGYMLAALILLGAILLPLAGIVKAGTYANRKFAKVEAENEA